jgi:hypothetical protein
MLAVLTRGNVWSLVIDGVDRGQEIVESRNEALMAAMYGIPGENLASLIAEIKKAYPQVTQIQATFRV